MLKGGHQPGRNLAPIVEDAPSGGAFDQDGVPLPHIQKMNAEGRFRGDRDHGKRTGAERRLRDPRVCRKRPLERHRGGNPRVGRVPRNSQNGQQGRKKKDSGEAGGQGHHVPRGGRGRTPCHTGPDALQVMPRARLELARDCSQGFLRPPRLPFRHPGLDVDFRATGPV